MFYPFIVFEVVRREQEREKRAGEREESAKTVRHTPYSTRDRGERGMMMSPVGRGLASVGVPARAPCASVRIHNSNTRRQASTCRNASLTQTKQNIGKPFLAGASLRSIKSLVTTRRARGKDKGSRITTSASLLGVGTPEVLVIGVVALLVFGPKVG